MNVRSSLICFLQFLQRTPRVLWVCRVPLISAIGGGVLIVSFAQTRDMFADLGLEWWRWGMFFAATFLWAWIVHWAARHVLRLDDWVPDAHVPGGITPARRAELQRMYSCAAVAWPRILGTAVFVFILAAMIEAYRNLSPATGLPEAERALNQLIVLITVTATLGVIYFVLVWLRRIIGAWLNTQLMGKRRQWPAPDPPLLTGNEALILDFARGRAQLNAAVAERTAWITLIISLSAGLVTAVFLFSLIAPHKIAEVFPRAVFVPVVLGSSVLLLTEIGAYSMRFRAPLLLVFVLAGGLASFVIDRFHDVRWVGRTGNQDRQITIETAVKRWEQANDCYTDNKRCPRPIIIAGSGGASRAAFMTASVVGSMLDLGNMDSAFRDVGKQIFALSTVSGSSVAAVTISAALQDAADAGHPNRPPCKKDVSDTAWFRTIDGRPDELWRDCLQRILAGDLLSPVLIGLFYRDSFPLGNPFNGEPWWADRAALLEQALERRYKLVVEGNADTCRADDPKPTGLCRPLGYHRDPALVGGWRPLLFINGTSVETGQRIIASDIEASSKRPQSQKSLFPLAYDLYEMRPAELKSDVLLSTAFTLSARFPIISPHGTLRGRFDQKGEKITDRIVDGGYFENDGLATAADIADTLKEAGLQPLIVSITNDPISADHALGLARAHQDNQPDLWLPKAEDKSLFESFTVIGRALYDTRSGHELGDTEYAKSVVGPDRLFLVTVRNLDSQGGLLCRQSAPTPISGVNLAAGMKDVSMSWWMSQPEQAFLDAQLCLSGTSDEIVGLIKLSGRNESQ